MIPWSPFSHAVTVAYFRREWSIQIYLTGYLRVFNSLGMSSYRFNRLHPCNLLQRRLIPTAKTTIGSGQGFKCGRISRQRTRSIWHHMSIFRILFYLEYSGSLPSINDNPVHRECEHFSSRPSCRLKVWAIRIDVRRSSILL